MLAVGFGCRSSRPHTLKVNLLSVHISGDVLVPRVPLVGIRLPQHFGEMLKMRICKCFLEQLQFVCKKKAPKLRTSNKTILVTSPLWQPIFVRGRSNLQFEGYKMGTGQINTRQPCSFSIPVFVYLRVSSLFSELRKC